jgi:CBS domain-containing protein
MKIAALMNASPCTASPDERLPGLLAKLSEQSSRLIYVVDGGGSLLGVISTVDVLRKLVPFYLDSNLARAVSGDDGLIKSTFLENKDTTAAGIMQSKVSSLRVDDHFLAAEALIRDAGVNALPVLDASGKLAGEITRRDILAHLVGVCLQDG